MRLYPARYKGMIFESFSLGTPTAPRESKEKKIYIKEKRKGKKHMENSENRGGC